MGRMGEEEEVVEVSMVRRRKGGARGRLRQRTSMGAYAWRSLDRVGFGRAHDSPLRRQRHEALLSVAIMMKSEAENEMKAEIGGLDMVI